MRLLAIETSSEACSVALFDDGAPIAHDHRVLGRGHAEQLVPMIAALPDRGRAEAIRVGLGPGSFTGVRIGIATARALAFAWNAQIAGFPTFALMAARVVSESPSDVTVCMNGGHGEWFVQHFDAWARPTSELQSLRPEDAMARPVGAQVVGNRAAELMRRAGTGHALLPDARDALLLDETHLTARLAPIYGREPDAKSGGAR